MIPRLTEYSDADLTDAASRADSRLAYGDLTPAERQELEGEVAQIEVEQHRRFRARSEVKMRVEEAAEAMRGIEMLEASIAQERERRDNAIRAAVAGGMTAYKIAQELGMSQQQVGRIIKAG